MVRLGSFAGDMTLRGRCRAQEAGGQADSPALHELDTEVVLDPHRENEKAREEASVGGIRGLGDLRVGCEEGGRVQAEAADTVLEEARTELLAVGDMSAVDNLGKSRSGHRRTLGTESRILVHQETICTQRDGRGNDLRFGFGGYG